MSQGTHFLKYSGGWFAVGVCFYLGAYITLCRPVPSGVFLPAVHSKSPLEYESLKVPTYRFGGIASANIFRPVQKLDRYFFPARWSAAISVDLIPGQGTMIMPPSAASAAPSPPP